MKVTDLKPEIVWKHFHEVTQVPRPSKKEGKIIAYLESFAKQHNLAYMKDEAGNILISKPATPGMESRQTVVLQSHMDMVCEKNNATQHDFDNDPIVYSDASQPIPVYPMSRLDEVVHALKVDVAIITVPEAAATDTYAELLAAGVNGIMNFSPVTLKPVRTREVIMPVVHNINIGLELEQIFYELKFPRT